MEGSCSQYDTLLGGEQKLPSSLPVGGYVSSRIQEIRALVKVIDTPSTAITEVRSFPKHMKRRAMSHNIKRIPQRLRELHATLREKSNTREGPSKVPRRKYRRRPKELLKEYNRRQQNNIWLETHIWHAKRFRMVKKWGYKIPFSPCDKSYRACYRASANHCLLQDISYHVCMELSGLEEDILLGLSKHTNPTAGLTFAAKATISGSREGSVMFYRANKYPYYCIDEINFIWKPGLVNKSRCLWLWCHPGSYTEFLEELIATFELIGVQSEEKAMEIDVNKEKSENKVELEKIKSRNVPFVRTPKYSNEKGITLIVLKDTLNRFRLLGPLSHSVLSQCLKPISLDKHHREGNQDWVKEYYFNEEYSFKRDAYDAQLKIWSLIRQFYSPGQLTPRCVLPLTIIDPRFIMPSSRTKAYDVSSKQELTICDISSEKAYADSPLWSSSVRDFVTTNKLSTEQLNRIRSEKIVPGLEVECFDDNEFEDVPSLPILLIQKPGSQDSSKRLGYGSGWDIVVPCGYAMPLWLSFVLSGARVGGLKEGEAFSRESGIHQGYQQPDTVVGKSEEIENQNEKSEQFFKLPPAKRRNYIKLNIPTPFHCPWSILTNDWDQTEEFYVMRNKKFLYLLQNSLKTASNCSFLNENEIFPGALIPVRIDFKGKGIFSPNAHICLLNNLDDLKNPPKEPQKLDEFHNERSNLRNKHKQLLKQLARKRHKIKLAEREERLKSLKEDNKDYKQLLSKYSSKKHIKEQADIIRNLWIPDCSTIKNIASRTIIGFVKSGDFCFTEGISSGVGYVTFSGIKEYLQTRFNNNKNKILIRCINTDQYRVGIMSVIN